MATDFLFIGNGILSFRFLWKPLLQLEGSHHFLKNLISTTVEETVFLNIFSDTDSNGSSFSVQ